MKSSLVPKPGDFRLEIYKDALEVIGTCARCHRTTAGHIKFDPSKIKMTSDEAVLIAEKKLDEKHKCPKDVLPYDGSLDRFIGKRFAKA